MEMDEMVKKAFEEIQSSGFIENQIKINLEKVVKETVAELLQSYGEFGKGLRNHLLTELKFDPSRLNIEGYQSLLLDTTKGLIDHAIRVEGVEAIKTALDRLFGDAPDEIKLSELVNKMKHFMLEHGNAYADGTEFTFIVKRENDDYFTYIALDPKPGKTFYQCEYRIGVTNREGSIFTAYVADRSFNSREVMNGLYGFEAYLFKLYAHKTIIIMDEEDVNTYYPDGDEED